MVFLVLLNVMFYDYLHCILDRATAAATAAAAASTTTTNRSTTTTTFCIFITL